ncbi:pectinesterase protein [Spatholobus suberectus]|nr:pectinesterase protein [Spatholobus suberectus]
MAFIKTHLLFVSLSCLLLHTYAASARTPQARVWTICKSTSNRNLCYKTILPMAVGSARFNVYKALKTEILATQKQVQATLNVIASLLTKPGNSNNTSDSLRICQDQYGNILDSIDQTIKQLVQRNVVEAQYKFSGVLPFCSTCNDEFKGLTSPIAKEAKDVYDLGSNCVDILAAIVDREKRRRGGKTGKGLFTGPSSLPGPCQGKVGLCN